MVHWQICLNMSPPECIIPDGGLGHENGRRITGPGLQLHGYEPSSACTAGLEDGQLSGDAITSDVAAIICIYIAAIAGNLLDDVQQLGLLEEKKCQEAAALRIGAVHVQIQKRSFLRRAHKRRGCFLHPGTQEKWGLHRRRAAVKKANELHFLRLRWECRRTQQCTAFKPLDDL